MEARDFCYWLKGYFELTDKLDLNTKQVEMIKQHLNLVINKHPAMSSLLPEVNRKQEALDEIEFRTQLDAVQAPTGVRGPTGSIC